MLIYDRKIMRKGKAQLKVVNPETDEDTITFWTKLMAQIEL